MLETDIVVEEQAIGFSMSSIITESFTSLALLWKINKTYNFSTWV